MTLARKAFIHFYFLFLAFSCHLVRRDVLKLTNLMFIVQVIESNPVEDGVLVIMMKVMVVKGRVGTIQV